MVYVHTRLDIVDNSGAIVVGCIQVLRRSSKRGAILGDYIICSVKKSVPSDRKNPILRGQIHKCIIVSTKSSFKRWGHIYIKSFKNSAVLYTNNGPLGNRIFFPIFHEFRTRGLSKIMFLTEACF